MKAEIHSVMNPKSSNAAQLGKRHDDSCSLSPLNHRGTKVLRHQSLASLVQAVTSFFVQF